MSDLSMQGNPHYEQAADVLRDLRMAEAQVGVATLALAFEQRTANLIAAYQVEVTVHGRIKGDGIAIDRHNEILDRLGL